MTEPTFLFIGPDKTGSTWVFEYLSRHPECYVPQAKDIYYFDQFHQRGWDWYAKFFADAPQTAKAVGEISHDYILEAQTAARIHAALPEAQMVAGIRNPIDRTFSQYLYLLRSGMARGSFRETLEREPRIVDNSRYSVMLAPFFDLFGRDQVTLLPFDDLAADVQGFADRLCAGIGTGSFPAEDIGEVRGASKARSPAVARLMKFAAGTTRALGLPGVVGWAKTSKLGRALYVPYKADEKPRISVEDHAYLAEVFDKEIDWCAEILGRDLTDWRKSPLPPIREVSDEV